MLRHLTPIERPWIVLDRERMNALLDSSARLQLRGRPDGEPVIHQRWDDLLFLHWPVDPVALRSLVSTAFEIDTFQGQAWIGLTPFRVEDIRLGPLPPLPA